MGLLSKRFHTDATFVKLILSMHSAVDCQATVAPKLFPTVVTSVRLIRRALGSVVSGCSGPQTSCHSRHNCRVYPQSALGGELSAGPGL